MLREDLTGEGSFERGPKGQEGDSHAKTLRLLKVELPDKIGHTVKRAFQINHKHISQGKYITCNVWDLH